MNVETWYVIVCWIYYLRKKKKKTLPPSMLSTTYSWNLSRNSVKSLELWDRSIECHEGQGILSRAFVGIYTDDRISEAMDMFLHH